MKRSQKSEQGIVFKRLSLRDLKSLYSVRYGRHTSGSVCSGSTGCTNVSDCQLGASWKAPDGTVLQDVTLVHAKRFKLKRIK